MSYNKKYLQELMDSLTGFYVVTDFVSEVLSLVSKSGQARRFFKILNRRLAFLKEYGSEAQEHHEEFERLDADLYSMHLESDSFNIRILYSFLEDGTILLRAFYERGGKTATDYTRQIPLAKERLQIAKEETHE